MRSLLPGITFTCCVACAQVIGDTGGMSPSDACAALATAISGKFARLPRSEMMNPSASAAMIKRTFTCYFARLQARPTCDGTI